MSVLFSVTPQSYSDAVPHTIQELEIYLRRVPLPAVFPAVMRGIRNRKPLAHQIDVLLIHQQPFVPLAGLVIVPGRGYFDAIGSVRQGFCAAD